MFILCKQKYICLFLITITTNSVVINVKNNVAVALGNEGVVENRDLLDRLDHADTEDLEERSVYEAQSGYKAILDRPDTLVK